MSAMRLSDVVRHDVAVDPEITGVTADSRLVRPGFLFAALPGALADGSCSFIPAVLKADAAAVLADNDVDVPAAPVVHATDLRRAYALAAAAFWGEQPRTCVAVTGTNGKTRSPPSAARSSRAWAARPPAWAPSACARATTA